MNVRALRRLFQAHEDLTVGVHGIADVSALALSATATSADSVVAATAASALATHEADTTAVHGIADTAKVVRTGVATTNGEDIVTGTATGSSLGGAANQKTGMHGAKVVQRASAAQAAVPTDAAGLTLYGFSEAQANAIVTLLNELRAALVEKGIIKGSA